jgi:hypothetical protein
MNNASNELYLPDDLYEAVVTRLADVMPLLGSRDDLVTRLGEVANVWPARVKEDSNVINFPVAI